MKRNRLQNLSIAVALTLFSATYLVAPAQSADRGSDLCGDLLGPARYERSLVVPVETPKGEVLRFRTDARGSANRRFALEAKLFESARDEDEIIVEWLYHPFFAFFGHNSFRVGNRLYEFTRNGWKIHETGGDDARAFLFNNPFFKSMHQKYGAQGMPPFSIGVPLRVPKWKALALDRWVRVERDNGEAFQFLTNNCNHCAIRAFKNSEIGDFSGKGLQNISSLHTMRKLLADDSVKREEPVLYLLSGATENSDELARLIPGTIYGETNLSEVALEGRLLASRFKKLVRDRFSPEPLKRPVSRTGERTIPEGPNQGKPLSESRPSLLILSDEEANRRLLRRREGSTLVANFVSGNSLWVADFPATPPESVSLLLHLERGGKIQHAQIRFQFAADHPVLLLEPMTGAPATVPVEPREVHDLLFDATAWLPKGEEGTFSVKKAVEGRYALQHRMRETAPVVELEQGRGRHIIDYELPLDETQRAEVIRAIFARNREIDRGLMYDYAKRHCATEVLAAFDALDPPDTWSASVRKRILDLYGRNLKRITRVMELRGWLDPEAARAVSFIRPKQGVQRFKNGNPKLPISHGLELEYDLTRSKRLLDYYRIEGVSDADWKGLSLEKRFRRINDAGASSNIVARILTHFKRYRLVRLDDAPEILPPYVVGEHSGNYEVNGVVVHSIEELREARAKIEDLLGPGSLQTHNVFPRSEVRGATGYTVYKTDQSVLLHLENSYAKYLVDPSQTPARRIVYWALGPLSDANRLVYLENEARANRGDRLLPLRRKRLITGPVLREGVYRQGYLGFEIRQFAQNAPDLIDEADELNGILERGELSRFVPYEGLQLVSEDLIPRYLGSERVASHASASHWLKFFRQIGLETEKRFPLRIAGGARGSERFTFPFRDWRNYPALTRLSPGERSALLADLENATKEYAATVDELARSSLPAGEKLIRLRVAIAKWGYQSRLSRMFVRGAP